MPTAAPAPIGSKLLIIDPNAPPPAIDKADTPRNINTKSSNKIVVNPIKIIISYEVVRPRS